MKSHSNILPNFFEKGECLQGGSNDTPNSFVLVLGEGFDFDM